MSEYCSGTNFTGSPGILANVTGVPANTRVSKSTIARRVVLVSRTRKNLIRINNNLLLESLVSSFDLKARVLFLVFLKAGPSRALVFGEKKIAPKICQLFLA